MKIEKHKVILHKCNAPGQASVIPRLKVPQTPNFLIFCTGDLLQENRKNRGLYSSLSWECTGSISIRAGGMVQLILSQAESRDYQSDHQSLFSVDWYLGFLPLNQQLAIPHLFEQVGHVSD